VKQTRLRKTKTTDPKDKHIHRNKHDHIQNHMWNIFVIVELVYGTWGKEGKEKRTIEHH
jgi:hypothetical protein